MDPTHPEPSDGQTMPASRPRSSMNVTVAGPTSVTVKAGGPAGAGFGDPPSDPGSGAEPLFGTGAAPQATRTIAAASRRNTTPPEEGNLAIATGTRLATLAATYKSDENRIVRDGPSTALPRAHRAGSAFRALPPRKYRAIPVVAALL